MYEPVYMLQPDLVLEELSQILWHTWACIKIPRNQDATVKLKSELISIKFSSFLVPLPTQ